ncbi:helix-turn-helix domain-containing protein [Jiella marina]|uniref:helix-turn-helix domain-containing protein n=1 Tax=Jiella sp. LLJ827 TaxID=2917712 RepID=UPI002101BB71|nr:helix-turn-helix domain-containing protein [Jiella sp. LLJ827]MCQ0988715.1 helix-turn-helix domain-containing protein [Jiella sp. LLJ827]
MKLRETLVDDHKRVPSLKFSTAGLDTRHQFDAWAEFTSSMCDLKPVTAPAEGFEASSASYHLGKLQLTSFQLSPMDFRYTREIQRRSGFDHWCLSALTKGPVGYESQDAEFRISTGELMLHSYASPFSGLMDKTNYSGIFFSRDDFWDIADHLDSAAHRLVQGPMSQIVRDFVVSLAHRAEGLTTEDARSVSEAFGHLLRAMIAHTPTAQEAAKAPVDAVQFDRARRYINANLKSPELVPDRICASIGVSRRQLYYLFEQQGGVATYIRNRRLAACYDALSQQANTKPIGVVAYEYGFTNLSSFYRQFSARYGCNPSEARAAAQHGVVPSTKDFTFLDWLRSTEKG